MLITVMTQIINSTDNYANSSDDINTDNYA